MTKKTLDEEGTVRMNSKFSIWHEKEDLYVVLESTGPISLISADNSIF